ncbi:MAG TPA: hypothetical protein VM123_02305 [archaeon]|nr:hypothetical protein [archaeon]
MTLNHLVSAAALTAFLCTSGCTAEKGDARKDPTVIAEFSPKSLAEPGAAILLSGTDNPLKETCLIINPSASVKLPGNSAEAPWDKARYLVFDVLHESTVTGAVRLEFKEEEETGGSLRARLGVMPGLRTRLVFPLEALDGQSVFLRRTPGRLKCVVFGRRVRPELISTATIGLDSVIAGQKLYISRIRLTSEPPGSYPMEGPPLVDSLGQWAARDWPGKTSDFNTLRDNLSKALAASRESSFPEEWSKYGGWKKLRFKGTGFFRVEKVQDRWWLADPEGYAFFSAGVDGISPLHAACPVEGIEPLFQWIPKEEIFKPALGDMWRQKTIDFAGVNLIRAFGPTWRRDWEQLTRSRMLEWRFNTLGNWSDSLACANLGLPYVIPMRGFPTTEKKLYRDFPDVFDPAYEERAGMFAGQLKEYSDDPLLIGYFLANEPQWAFGNLYPASEMLESGEPSASRTKLAGWLKERYKNDIQAFSKSWGREFSSFEQLEQGALRHADSFSDQAREDLREFSALMVEQYLKPVNEAVRRVDKNHLNLGIRWAGLGSEFCYLTGSYCDVFSVNMYRMLPDSAAISEVTRRTGKPVLIGEYHFGAVDRGLLSTGLRGVASQTDRGTAYRAYVETGAALPQLVGAHFFIWNDQPVLGRYDGENFNIGLVDACNTPYREMVEAMRLTNERIYLVASGKEKPFEGRAESVPQIGF